MFYIDILFIILIYYIYQNILIFVLHLFIHLNLYKYQVYINFFNI